MPLLMRRTPVFVAFSVLAFAAPVHATCAWVLWTETEAIFKDKGGWKDVGFNRNVYETRKACEEALVWWIKEQRPRLAGELTKSIPDRSVTEVVFGKTGAVVYQYSCLPDTIDPRGPKAK
jgi:hypothetical protein